MAGRNKVGRTFSLVHLPAGRSQHTRQHGECMCDSLRLTGRSNHSLQEQEPQNDTWHKGAVVNFPNISDPHPDQLALPTSMSIPHAFPTLKYCFCSTQACSLCHQWLLQYVLQPNFEPLTSLQTVQPNYKLGLCEVRKQVNKPIFTVRNRALALKLVYKLVARLYIQHEWSYSRTGRHTQLVTSCELHSLNPTIMLDRR